MDSGHWVADPTNSTLSVSIRHLGVATVTGDFSGIDVNLEAEADGAVRVTASIPTDTISTGDEKRDGFLSSADFFQSDTHPFATFEGGGTVSRGDSWSLAGTLTIAGVSAPLTLKVEQSPGVVGQLAIQGTVDRHLYNLRFPQAAGAGDAVVGRKVNLRGTVLLRPKTDDRLRGPSAKA